MHLASLYWSVAIMVIGVPITLLQADLPRTLLPRDHAHLMEQTGQPSSTMRREVRMTPATAGKSVLVVD